MIRLNELAQKITKPVSLKQREPFVYIERAAVKVKNNVVVAITKKESTVIPVAAVASVMLGPGTSITNEAVKILSKRECCLIWTGGGGLPIFNYSGNYRSPRMLLKQVSLIESDLERMRAVRILLNARNKLLRSDDPKMHPDDINSAKSVQELFLVEARWAKRYYAKICQEFNIDDNIKETMKLANYFCYGVVTPIILNLGLNPNVGIMHGKNRGGGLIFDLADVIKPPCSIRIAAQASVNNWNPNKTKFEVLKHFKENNLYKKLILLTEEIYDLGG